MKANTVVFTAADGRVDALPLGLLLERGAVIADKVNGEDLSASFGGSNQLWIPGLPAKYFVRDIVSIDFEWRDQPPVLEDFIEDGMEYQNRPNISAKARKGMGEEHLTGTPVEFEGWADDYDRAIVAVQFSLDGGTNWTTQMTDKAQAGRWVYWHFAYTPEQEGDYVLKVRAVNEDGKVSPIPAAVSFVVS